MKDAKSCDDERVHKHLHTDPMVAAMRARGLRVEYIEAPGVAHEEPAPIRCQRLAFIKRFLCV